MRWSIPAAALGAYIGASALTGATLFAQGTTTATVRGIVRAPDGADVDGARVRVVSVATGVIVEAEVRHGRFLVQGLEIGGPYTVEIRQLGFAPQQRGGLFLSLGQPLALAFALAPVANPLAPVRVEATGANAPSGWPAGTATTISDSLLHRLPTLNRNFYDFVSLAPQVSTRVILPAGGISGGGVNLRFNNYLVDGAPERAVNGNSANALDGGKSVPIDAVKEYQVLLAPFDVRYGDFAGALVNTVTKSGTNTLQGTAFAYARNDRLARHPSDSASVPYDREQFGFSLAGPIVHDRLHFLIAPEFQHLTSPAPGPYIGQPATSSSPVPVTAAQVTQFANDLRADGLGAGSGGAVPTENPLTNVFARLDLAVPEWNSRAVASLNYTGSSNNQFSRATPDTFSLSSYQAAQQFASRLSSVQLHTNLRGGAYNELTLSERSAWTSWIPNSRQPVVLVTVPNSSGIGSSVLRAGTAEAAQGLSDPSSSLTLIENLTLPVGVAHELTVGAQMERFSYRRRGVSNNYGTWTFSSLDSLQENMPQRLDAAEDLGGAGAPIAGGQYGAYVGDHWRATDRLSIVAGLRADALVVSGHAPYVALVDSLFGRRTDDMPVSRVQLSPRVGFDWDAFGTGRDQIRGGAGIFTGRPPLAWEQAAIYSYGTGVGALRCGTRPADAGTVPGFVPDYRGTPSACANGAGAALGDVDLLDRHLRMAQTLRGSLAYERRLPWDIDATAEALVTRNISDFVFVNLNLQGPVGTDAHGRVMYGSVSPAGAATPALVAPGFSEVIDLRNNSQNHSYELSGKLAKRFSGQFEGSVSYTYSQVRDAQLPLRSGVPGRVNWGTGRAVSGNENDLGPGVSLYDLPQRLVLAGTYPAPWHDHPTTLSFYYIGESGSPLTYIAGGQGRLGDLNADGALNDPLYIPKSALDPAEITFSGVSDVVGADNSPAAQAARISLERSAFEKLINDNACLRHQRGRIMQSNSCRQPWTNTTSASLRQSFSADHGHTVSAQLDVFNVLNLLSRGWGLYRVASTSALLQQVGETPGPPSAAQPVYVFDSTRPLWATQLPQSAFQLQLSLRYTY